MAETMKLNDILSDLQNVGSSGMEKTAEETPAAGQTVKTARSELVQALDNAMATPKTASAGDPTPVVDKVTKIASDLADSEGEALTKEAVLYGAAVADGFMARIGQYEQVGATKTASAPGGEQNFEKFAAENPEITKQAVELGYLHGKAQIGQLKQASFQQGHADASAQIQELSQTEEGREKLAAIAQELEGKGQTKVASELEKWAATPEGQEAMPYVKLGYDETMEKLAAVEQGYSDTAGEINKLAEDVFVRGYNDTIKVLQAM